MWVNSSLMKSQLKDYLTIKFLMIVFEKLTELEYMVIYRETEN